MSDPKTLSPQVGYRAAFDSSSDRPLEELGLTLEVLDDGVAKKYKYVQFAAATLKGVAQMVVPGTTTRVTQTVANSSRNLPAGVAVADQAANAYGWIQIEGPVTGVVTADAGNIALGDAVIYHTANGQVSRVAAGTAPTHKPLGFCHVAEAAGVVGLILDLPA